MKKENKKQEKKEECPLCRVSEEVLEILKKEGKKKEELKNNKE